MASKKYSYRTIRKVLGAAAAVACAAGCGGDFERDACQASSAGEAAPRSGSSEGTRATEAAGACSPVELRRGRLGSRPSVLAITPADASVAVEPDSAIIIELSEALDESSVNSGTIQLLDRNVQVRGKLTYADRRVTFTPAAPLALLTSYEVRVTAGVTDVNGMPLAQPASSHFVVRDGAWSLIDVVTDRAHELSRTLAMDESGKAWLGWTGSAGSYCPVSMRAFRNGAAHGPDRTLPHAPGDECYQLTVAANAAGTTAFSWTPTDGEPGSFVEQYRGGSWQGARVSDYAYESPLSVAVAPDDRVTFFAHSSAGAKAWMSDVEGRWESAGQRISIHQASSPLSVAFDALGNALALWSARERGGKERILASRFTTLNGRWEEAVDLPGSVPDNSRPDTSLRGAPVVAMDENGTAMALWVGGATGFDLQASRFSAADGWSDPSTVAEGISQREIAPALVFDGNSFVAAWSASNAHGEAETCTARFAGATGWSACESHAMALSEGGVARQPALVSDGRQNLMLVWTERRGDSYELVYRRYALGQWQDVRNVPGGAFRSQYVASDALPFAMSSSGTAALAWIDYDAEQDSAYAIEKGTVKLASFH
jgi:Bacterial Ig-like domain